jgi:hypothetical protein
LQVPKWKWEEIAMDFIMGLPRTQSVYNSIWVIVDRLNKVAHFLSVKTTYSRLQLAELYMSRIFCLHGAVQSRQRSYTNHWRRELSFEVGDFVYLKVSPMRGLCHFKVRGKLAPRFIGPFMILEKRGEVAYQLELPP